jgi:hypothetical protein
VRLTKLFLFPGERRIIMDNIKRSVIRKAVIQYKEQLELSANKIKDYVHDNAIAKGEFDRYLFEIEICNSILEDLPNYS